MSYTFTRQGIQRPYVPERDLFRLIKYGTYDLLDLDAYTPELVPAGELTDEEHELIHRWYVEVAEEEDPLTIKEAYGG
jgi:hypothetical protein